jgi:OOP family OmpA-OmpF porin
VDADVAVSVSVAGGRVVLAGAIGDDAQRAQLLAAVQEVLDPGSVDDLLAVDPAAAADDSRLADLAAVSRVLPVVLVEGSARLAGEAIAVTGVDVDDAARQRLETVTAGLDTDVLVDLQRRPVADPLLADTIAADVERLLAEQPLRFVSGVLFADPDAGTTLDRLAGLLKAADGLDIGVVGFTDTAGNAATNLRISLLRAEEVENQLVRRGVPAEDLTVAGFGETTPVLVDGVEDPAASRRVEIVVRLAEPAP